MFQSHSFQPPQNAPILDLWVFVLYSFLRFDRYRYRVSLSARYQWYRSVLVLGHGIGSDTAANNHSRWVVILLINIVGGKRRSLKSTVELLFYDVDAMSTGQGHTIIQREMTDNQPLHKQLLAYSLKRCLPQRSLAPTLGIYSLRSYPGLLVKSQINTTQRDTAYTFSCACAPPNQI